jgi:adenosine deaminase
MFFSPTFLMKHGVSFDTIWTGIAAGIIDAETEHGIVCRMILDVHKPAGPGPAGELIELAARCDRELLIGIGGDAGELGVDLPGLATPFARARRLGFHTTMHLGEEGPASDIGVGLHHIGVERIDHGFSLLHDSALLDEVVERQVPVTCCPTSNHSIGLVDSIAQHPIMTMYDAGVLVTVNSDNAEMFGVDVADELMVLRDAFDLSFDDVAELCMNGVDAAWVDESTRRAMRTAFEEDIAALR